MPNPNPLGTLGDLLHLDSGLAAYALPLLEHFGLERFKEFVQAGFSRANARVVKGMTAKGMTPDQAAPALLVHDAQFRLWRSLIPSGDLADFVRDRQNEKIIAAVVPQVRPETPLAEIVRLTAVAIYDLTF